MNRLLTSLLVMLVLATGLHAQTAPDAAELTALLNNFLAGAGRNDVDIHENFWADDLIYTGAAGRRVSKTDITSDLRKAPATPAGPKTIYGAEDIRIQQYGDTAIVAFRLVATVERGAKTEVSKYFNTGTFLRRKGKWQVVAWQATKLPRPEDASKSEVAEVEAELQRALLNGNVEALETLLDESFAWTDNGSHIPRAGLIAALKTGKLKFSNLETSNVSVSVNGDTAVVRGASQHQTREPNASPIQSRYTLVLVNKGGPWKAVSLHSGRQ